jgi:hypothetical protein
MKLNSNRTETNAIAKLQSVSSSNSGSNRTSTENGFANYCLAYCRKLISEIREARQRLTRQFQLAFAGQEKLLRLALNEAEALAFLTDYPHLVFPTLAMEKVQYAATWKSRQQQIAKDRARLSPF